MSYDITSSTWWNDLGATPPDASLRAPPRQRRVPRPLQ